MDPTENRKTSNYLRCVTQDGRRNYKVWIEDVRGNGLTPPLVLTKEEVGIATQGSIAPHTRENDLTLGGGEEDYRLPIFNEEILRARLYPTK